jgi:hypothetical protein
MTWDFPFDLSLVPLWYILQSSQPGFRSLFSFLSDPIVVDVRVQNGAKSSGILSPPILSIYSYESTDFTSNLTNHLTYHRTQAGVHSIGPETILSHNEHVLLRTPHLRPSILFWIPDSPEREVSLFLPAKCLEVTEGS